MQLFFGGITWRSALLVMMDHALIVLGVVAGVLIRQTEPTFGWGLIGRAFLIASVLQLAMHYSDLYDLRTLRDRRDLIVGVLQAVGAASVILALPCGISKIHEFTAHFRDDRGNRNPARG